jgi:hypothetical protein
VAACATLRAVSGLVFVRAISWLHFISGGIPICLRPVISGRQSLCAGYEVKPLRRYFPLPPETMNACPAQAELTHAGASPNLPPPGIRLSPGSSGGLMERLNENLSEYLASFISRHISVLPYSFPARLSFCRAPLFAGGRACF